MTRHEERLVLRDQTGCMWFLGVLFLAGGSTALALWLGAGSGARPHGWGNVLVVLIGSAHLAAGAWLLASSPSVTVRLRSDRPVLLVVRRWLVFRRIRQVHLDDIRFVDVRQEQDSDGDPVFRLELQLRSGERVRLHSVPMHTRTPIDAAADRLRTWSGDRLLRRQHRDS